MKQNRTKRTEIGKLRVRNGESEMLTTTIFAHIFIVV